MGFGFKNNKAKISITTVGRVIVSDRFILNLGISFVGSNPFLGFINTIGNPTPTNIQEGGNSNAPVFTNRLDIRHGVPSTTPLDIILSPTINIISTGLLVKAWYNTNVAFSPTNRNYDLILYNPDKIYTFQTEDPNVSGGTTSDDNIAIALSGLDQFKNLINLRLFKHNITTIDKLPSKLKTLQISNNISIITSLPKLPPQLLNLFLSNVSVEFDSTYFPTTLEKILINSFPNSGTTSPIVDDNLFTNLPNLKVLDLRTISIYYSNNNLSIMNVNIDLTLSVNLYSLFIKFLVSTKYLRLPTTNSQLKDIIIEKSKLNYDDLPTSGFNIFHVFSGTSMQRFSVYNLETPVNSSGTYILATQLANISTLNISNSNFPQNFDFTNKSSAYTVAISSGSNTMGDYKFNNSGITSLTLNNIINPLSIDLTNCNNLVSISSSGSNLGGLDNTANKTQISQLTNLVSLSLNKNIIGSGLGTDLDLFNLNNINQVILEYSNLSGTITLPLKPSKIIQYLYLRNNTGLNSVVNFNHYDEVGSDGLYYNGLFLDYTNVNYDFSNLKYTTIIKCSSNPAQISADLSSIITTSSLSRSICLIDFSYNINLVSFVLPVIPIYISSVPGGNSDGLISFNGCSSITSFTNFSSIRFNNTVGTGILGRGTLHLSGTNLLDKSFVQYSIDQNFWSLVIQDSNYSTIYIDTLITNAYSIRLSLGIKGGRNLLINGASNGTPTGIYQAPVGFVLGSNDGTPVTVKEMMYVLVNNYTWTITSN